MVRPEDARIASSGFDADDKELKWSGRIAHMIFRGPSRSVFVETEQGRLNVDAPAFGQYSVGDNVTVVVPQRAAWAVAAEEAIQ
ncbi:MAG: iron(III) transport system ATP-binding protein [Bradyrhizobium sp.]|jgi:iron(III) transport system ATP-binding protein|nr:iron(III) transport system ATP-binding protein [Bradyrhizobium sp.]